ncbi:MAG TPA: PCRF domain-containing protein, partial [Acidimicrobiales bacterium]
MAADAPRRGEGEPDRVDIPEQLRSLAARIREAERFLGADGLAARRAELEQAASTPDLWDDADNARAVTTELGRVSEDLEVLSGLHERLSDAETLQELMQEEVDESLRPEVEQVISDLDQTLGALELRALFGGHYDDGDAV